MLIDNLLAGSGMVESRVVQGRVSALQRQADAASAPVVSVEAHRKAFKAQMAFMGAKREAGRRRG